MNEDSEHRMLNIMDRLYLSRLEHIETRLETLEKEVEREIQEFQIKAENEWTENRKIMNAMTRNVQVIIDRQEKTRPALESMNQIINTGITIKWLAITIVGMLAALTTGATAWDALRGWLK